MGIDKDKSVQVWAVLDRDTYKELRQLADDQERSISKQTAYIIKEFLKNIKK